MKPMLLAVLFVLSSPAPADAPRDPTRPPPVVRGDARAVERTPVLSAILGSASERTAIFNGKLVRGGDSVGSYDIEAVLEDGVRYRHAGVSSELHLHHFEAFKKPSTAAARAPVGDR